MKLGFHYFNPARVNNLLEPLGLGLNGQNATFHTGIFQYVPEINA